MEDQTNSWDTIMKKFSGKSYVKPKLNLYGVDDQVTIQIHREI